MAKFKFVYWLLEFLISQDNFVFEWDEGNLSKNKSKHGVVVDEIESVFEDENMAVLGEQYQPVVSEDRYGLIGKAASEEILFVCFTIRQGRIRVISARFANKKERNFYE